MKLLPIVPGCKAVIIWSYAGNRGKEVNVIRFIGDSPKVFNGKIWVRVIGNNVWEIQENLVGVGGCTGNFISESQLMRIDGHQEKISHDQKEMDNVGLL